jgi:hypothetical protein
VNSQLSLYCFDCFGLQLKVCISYDRMVRLLNHHTAAVGVGELNESTSQELEEVKKILEEKTNALHQAQEEIQTLKQRLSESNAGT